MIASAASSLHQRLPAKFATPDDQGLVQ
jgi:hypothetical protein